MHLDFFDVENIGIFVEVLKNYNRNIGVIGRMRYHWYVLNGRYGEADALFPLTQQEVIFHHEIKKYVENDKNLYVYVLAQKHSPGVIRAMMQWLPCNFDIIKYNSYSELTSIIIRHNIGECFGLPEQLEHIDERYFNHAD